MKNPWTKEILGMPKRFQVMDPTYCIEVPPIALSYKKIQVWHVRLGEEMSDPTLDHSVAPNHKLPRGQIPERNHKTTAWEWGEGRKKNLRAILRILNQLSPRCLYWVTLGK